MKRPNIFLQLSLGTILKLYAIIVRRHKVIYSDKIIAPAIVLANHTAFPDYVYTFSAIYPKRVNFIAAEKMFYEKSRGFFLRLSRSIPKCLFQADTRSVIDALKILHLKKGIVGIYPEGQISMVGKTYELPKAITKFIRKANVNVYVAKNFGSSLLNPPWSKFTFNGPVHTHVKKIYHENECKNYSEEDIYQKITEELAYNSSEYNLIKNDKYHVRKIDNLENVIYHCPKCGVDDLYTEKIYLKCPNCKLSLEYNQYGRIGDYTLYDLYHIEELALQQEIDKDSNFKLVANVILETHNHKNIIRIGYGELTLNRDLYFFKGFVNNQEKIYQFETKDIQYIPSDIGVNIQIYSGYKFYQFVFENKKLPTKFMLAGEYFYRLKH